MDPDDALFFEDEFDLDEDADDYEDLFAQDIEDVINPYEDAEDLFAQGFEDVVDPHEDAEDLSTEGVEDLASDVLEDPGEVVPSMGASESFDEAPSSRPQGDTARGLDDSDQTPATVLAVSSAPTGDSLQPEVSRPTSTLLRPQFSEKKQMRYVIAKASRYGYVRVLEELRHLEVFAAFLQSFDFCDSIKLPLKKRYSPLMYACEGKHTEVVRFLLDGGARGVRLNRRAHVFYKEKQKKGPKRPKAPGLNAVHVACVGGDVEILRLLLNRAEKEGELSKKTLNAMTKDGISPFMYALKGEHTELIDVLLETGLVDLTVATKKGQNVLHNAARMQRVDYLKKLHPLITAQETEPTPERESIYMAVDMNGWNIVHHACAGGSIEVLQWLFENVPALKDAGILNAQTKRGYTPLLIACEYQKVEVVKALLGVPSSSSTELGTHEVVRVDLYVTDVKTEGSTGLLSGLHLAASHDSQEIASVLLSKGCHMDIVNSEGNTALHIAVRRSSQRVEDLLRRASTPEMLALRNQEGQTPDDVEPEDAIPIEIRKEGEEAIKVYKKALREGRIKIPRCNLLILGQERMGKTSLLTLLLGGKFNPDQDPTRGIDNTIVDTVDNRSINPAQWVEADQDHQVRENEEVLVSTVAGELGSTLSKKERKDKQPRHVSEEELLQILDQLPGGRCRKRSSRAEKSSRAVPRTDTDRSQPSSLASVGGTESSQPFQATTVAMPPVLPSSTPSQPITNKPSPRVASLQHAPSEPPLPEEPLPGKQPQQPKKPSLPPESRRRPSGVNRQQSASIGRRWLEGDHEKQEPTLLLNTYDFAGQKEYRPMHHCFLVRRAIYLVVFNLQLILQFIQGKSGGSNPLEEVRYWLNSIHAHIHVSDKDDKKMKTVFLVGTHRAPKNPKQGKPIEPKELSEINKVLKDIFFKKDKHIRCVTHLNFVTGTFDTEDDKLAVYTDVENSMDGEDEREASGASALQRELRKVCGIGETAGEKAKALLRFLEEDRPVLWLRFEERLKSERERREKAAMVVSIAEVAKIGERSGIASGKEMDTALKFFHNTGTIILLRELPTMFLGTRVKGELEKLVLLDPKWLIRVMREVMELLKKGSRLVGGDIRELEVTGKAKESLLRDCWKGYYDEAVEASFRHLCLMLQAYCLIYPIESSQKPIPSPPQPSHSAPSASIEGSSPATQPSRSQSEGVRTPPPSRMFLIPCKLPPKEEEDEGELRLIKFYFDFCEFLPAEIYHRFICRMLAETKKADKAEFSKTWCKFYEVLDCPLLKVNIVEEEHLLVVSVRFEPKEMNSKRPTSWLYLIHDHLHKICKNSGLEGLIYNGGPWVERCPNPYEECIWVPPGVLKVVSYPETEPEEKCQKCCLSFNDDHVNCLFNPKYKKRESQANPPGPTGAPTPQEPSRLVHQSQVVQSSGGDQHTTSTTQSITAQQAFLASPGSNVTFVTYPPGVVPHPQIGLPTAQAFLPSSSQPPQPDQPSHYVSVSTEALGPQLVPSIPPPQQPYSSVNGSQPNVAQSDRTLAVTRPSGLEGVQPADPENADSGSMSSGLPNTQGSTNPIAGLPTGPVQPVPHEDSRLTEDNDFHEVVESIEGLSKTEITKLGVKVGLGYRWLRDYESKDNYLFDVVSAWLRRQDKVEQMCPPTWRNLVRALRKIDQNGIADQVERKIRQP